jgi:hypothetical protein
MSDQNGRKNAKDIPAWKNVVITTLTLPDLASSATAIPLPQPPNLVQDHPHQVVQQLGATPRQDSFQIDQSLKDLADYQDLQNEQRRALQSELGYALREPSQAQERPRGRDES